VSPKADQPETPPLSGEFLLNALESGQARAAERDEDGRWKVNADVKAGILEIFRTSPVVVQHNEVHPSDFANTFFRSIPFRDKALLPVRRFTEGSQVRMVPGGSAVRRGAHIGAGVVIMPPSYVNVGAFVGDETMIDSHVLVGSCAQIGARVHLSAGAPFVGGNCGIYEGILVRAGAVLAAGVVLAGGSIVFDLVNERELRGTREAPLEIPERAVVVPGTRPVRSAWGRERGLSAACALIVKYRDEKTDRATALEDALR